MLQKYKQCRDKLVLTFICYAAVMLILLFYIVIYICIPLKTTSSSAYVKHSVTTCRSKYDFNCYSSTFSILSTLFFAEFSRLSYYVYLYAHIYVFKIALVYARWSDTCLTYVVDDNEFLTS